MSSTLSAVSARRIIIQRSWIGISVLYGLLRAFLVWQFLADYNVNAATFLAVELISSALYGMWSGKFVGALIDGDRRSVLRSAPKAAVSYFAPDAYILASAGRLPGPVLEVVVGVVLVTTGLTTVGIWARVRTARRLASTGGRGEVG